MNVRFTWFAAGLGAIAVVFWLLGSGVGSVLPLLVLLACPLMTLVMMRGMGNMHGRPPHTDTSESSDAPVHGHRYDDESR